MRILLFLLVLLAGSPCVASALGIERELLAQSDRAWDGSAWLTYPDAAPQISLLRLRIPPQTVLDWHQHPMVNLAYVERGTLTVERRDNGRQRTFTQGDVIAELVDVPHRGHTGTEAVVLLVFYAGAEGLPLSIPANAGETAR